LFMQSKTKKGCTTSCTAAQPTDDPMHVKDATFQPPLLGQ
jgi:hypothetical protein